MRVLAQQPKKKKFCNGVHCLRARMRSKTHTHTHKMVVIMLIVNFTSCRLMSQNSQPTVAIIMIMVVISIYKYICVGILSSFITLLCQVLSKFIFRCFFSLSSTVTSHQFHAKPHYTRTKHTCTTRKEEREGKKTIVQITLDEQHAMIEFKMTNARLMNTNEFRFCLNRDFSLL